MHDLRKHKRNMADLLKIDKDRLNMYFFPTYYSRLFKQLSSRQRTHAEQI